MSERQSVTSLDSSPEDERKRRMVRYSVAMGIRTLCIVAGVFTTGFWMWFFFALAIFLPYFAVVIANTQGPSTKKQAAAVAPKMTIKANDIRIDE